MTARDDRQRKNTPAAHRHARRRPQPPPRSRLFRPLRSLSARLLLLTAAFIFLGVLLVFLPTLSSYRLTWLKDRIAMAEVATLALSAAPADGISDSLRQELLNSAGVLVVVVRTEKARKLVLQSRRPPMAAARHDLRRLGWWQALRDTLATLLHGGERVVVVIDRPPTMQARFIELAMHERPLYEALLAQAAIIMRYALVLALFAGLALYLALHVLFIRPVRRLARAMTRFGAAPDSAPAMPPLGGRADELGALEQAFIDMREQIRRLLDEQRRMAALGAAVSRIAHELRNMLTAAHMISDRLAAADDPLVRRFSPKLLHSIERAISFCSATLKYGRLREPAPRRRHLPLRPLVEEVFAALPDGAGLVTDNRVPADLLIDADPDQLFRALFNLAHNAARALRRQPPADGAPPTLCISARALHDGVEIIVADNGPGLPEKVRRHLFEPFVAASAAHGGTGLGLAITQEIVRLHEGEITLLSADEASSTPGLGSNGTAFRLRIPHRLRMVHDAGGAETALRGEERTDKARR